MRAAVVRSFDQPLVDRGAADPRAGRRAGARPHRDVWPLPHRHPRRPRRMARQAVPAVHPGPRGRRRHRARRRRQRCTGSSRACASRCPGSATPAASAATATRGRETLCEQQLNMGYGIDGCVRRVHRRLRAPRRAGARRHQLGRRRAADLRGRDDLQGRQGLGRHARPAWSPCSAPAASATWRSSTRASPARRSSRSTPTPRACRRRSRLGAEHIVNPLEEDPIAAIQRLGGARCGDLHRGHAGPPSSRPSARWRAVARSSASGSRPRTTCGSRSSRPSSAGSTSRARSSARTTTSRRSSTSTAAG